MDIDTDGQEVEDARRTALELLLSDHVGDCEGPCQRACPAHMDIPLMLRQIEYGNIREALMTVKQTIALPAVLGRICPAPCEKACRRGQVDQPIAICLLKRVVADADLACDSLHVPQRKPRTGKHVAVVGAGPTGLSAAYYLLQEGHDCKVMDDRAKPGGMLRYGVPEIRLPRSVLDSEIDIIRHLGADFRMQTQIGKDIPLESLETDFDALILAMGEIQRETCDDFGLESTDTGIRVNTRTYETSLKGVFAGGNAIRAGRMAVRSVAHGRSMAFSASRFLNREDRMETDTPFHSRVNKLRPEEIEAFVNLANQQKDQPFLNKRSVNVAPSEAVTPEQAALEAARCLHCECRKPDTCKLRQYAQVYRVHSHHFNGHDRRIIERIDHHPVIVYEPGKCIKCGLCVRITEASGEDLGLTFIGRGFDVRIGVPLNQTLDKALAKTAAQCVEACPTGALAFKDSEQIDENVRP